MAFSSGFLKFLLHFCTGRHIKHSGSHLQATCFLSHSEVAFFGQHAMATLVCLPLKTACHAQPGLAWVDQSSSHGKYFIVFWHLPFRCHYLLIYPMNRCMHMLFQYCISTVMDEYTINFDGSYCKYDVIGHPKEVNFSRGPILPIPAVYWEIHLKCGDPLGLLMAVISNK